MQDLDRFDRRLLALLSVDCRRTGEDLSREVGLSPAACLRRVQRLRHTGAIEREIAILSPEVQPRGTTIIVLVTIDRHNPSLIDSLSRRLRHREEVERMFSVTGEDDLVVILNCSSMAAFADFCDEFFDEAPVEGYETLVVLREYQKEVP